MEKAISQLIEYAVRHGWIVQEDRVWASNRLLEALGLESFGGLVKAGEELPPIQQILNTLCDDAFARGIIAGNSADYYDLLDTKLMGILTPRPGEVIRKFWELYETDPADATDWYYALSGDTNYIRRERIRKDLKWTTETEYGALDITVNLSKPEKDPKAIAAAGKAAPSGYPKCLLCAENEGYAGSLRHPARQNHRIIPIQLDGGDFFLQFSPYVYYNEHCIVFNKEHVPMHIDLATFRRLLDFVSLFPHYFIGSNADLPIVGGSVLSHDHFQGGKYEFPMARATVEESFEIPGFTEIAAGIVNWPMSVIRISGKDRGELADCAAHILDRWIGYDDPVAGVFHETEGVRHNTITPIARRRGEMYEMDLVLRNNLTTDENPLGVFHPHADKHHIKKENIGLIEVMGLAVLPARLKKELAAVAKGIISGADLRSDPDTASHAEWAEEIISRYSGISADNIDRILRDETGHVFSKVLEDAGVFKRNETGKAQFRAFIDIL